MLVVSERVCFYSVNTLIYNFAFTLLWEGAKSFICFEVYSLIFWLYLYSKASEKIESKESNPWFDMLASKLLSVGISLIAP